MARVLTWATQTVQASFAVFLPVDEQLRPWTTGPVVVFPENIVADSTIERTRRLYLSGLHRHDVFAPRRFAASSATVVGIDDIGGRAAFARSRYAIDFLGRFGVGDITSMYLRRDGVVAGQVLVGRPVGAPPFQPEQLVRLRASQPFIEEAYAIARASSEPQPSPDELLRAARLTPRETEVAALIAVGARNADIARALYLSIATVKTHVANILAKCGVASRTELIISLHAARTTPDAAPPEPAAVPASLSRAPAAVPALHEQAA